jgi:hypothetical protein
MTQFTPDVIKQAFTEAQKITFHGRGFNYFKYRSVNIPGLKGEPDSSIGLGDFFSSLGIGATRLASLFEGDPENDEDYEALDAFPFDQTSFLKLAAILEKPIDAARKDPRFGGYDYVFTVYPDGRISNERSAQD